MPYSVGAKGSYGCNGYPTVDNKGKVYGCHKTKAEAIRQLQALSAATPTHKRVDEPQQDIWNGRFRPYG